MKGCSHCCSNPLQQNQSNLYPYLCRGGINPPKPVGDGFSESTPCTSPVFPNSAKPLPNAQSCTKPVGEGVVGKVIRRRSRSRGREIGAGAVCERSATWGLNTELKWNTQNDTEGNNKAPGNTTQTTTANTTDRQDRVTCSPGLQVARRPAPP